MGQRASGIEPRDRGRNRSACRNVTHFARNHPNDRRSNFPRAFVHSRVGTDDDVIQELRKVRE
jgi:hypothetical protein